MPEAVPPGTIGELLARAAARGRGGLRFVARDESERFFGWAELAARAQEVAGGLQALGVAPGERVALILPTAPEFFDAFFGALLAGAVPVPLYPPVRLGRLDEYHRQTAAMLDAAGARVVLTERRLQALLGETIALARPALGCRLAGELPPGRATPVAVDPEALGLVQFSSGSTVAPKPVALSHRALLAQTRTLNALWPETPEFLATGVSWLPLYHDMGLIGCILPALELPSTMTLIPPELFVTRPALWLRAISRHRAFISPAPSFAYGLCVARIRDEELEGVDLSSWRAALNGAEAVAPSVVRAFLERFAPYGFRPEAMTPVYGMSEAALAVTFSDLEQPWHCRSFDRARLAEEGEAQEAPEGWELASVGKALPGFELEIRDETGRPVPSGRVGRVWIAGPSLMAGYLGRPEATAAALVDGWLDTGDLGFVHAGELFLTGRAKDVLILRGRNHAPETVEHALAGLAGFRAGCAVAASWLPPGAEGEILAVFVEHTRESTREERRELPEAVRTAVLASSGLAVDAVVVLAPGTLPRTSSGKLRRGETLRRHLAGELAPPRAVNVLSLAGAFARSQLAYARLRFGRRKEGAGG